MVRFLDHLRELSASFDVLLCDVWGVIHNGVAAFPEPCEALARFRAGGGTVVLITNAPRPAASVEQQLRRLHIGSDVYDAIATSGDVTRHFIADHAGKAAFHLGPPRDQPLFDDLDVAFAAEAGEADYIICTGLFDDETETPETYRALLEDARARNLAMVCANPDLVVERGHKLIYCAGALAELYRTLGGDVTFGGKPHAPIYEQALAQAAERRGAPVARERVLAIGDSVRTDLAGANNFGVACLFVSAGIHASEVGARDNPDAAALRTLFSQASRPPLGVTRKLRW
ncbi:MAG: TIGR01459 family HAD-type hydrolase [Xanthobacteraceae bacterium]|nr:MAG: TIGR01459 family HAD-type hydrolase [Xanthobacteraceae bacterium]